MDYAKQAEQDFVLFREFLAENKAISMQSCEDIYNSYFYCFYDDRKCQIKVGKSERTTRITEQMKNLGSQGTFYILSPGIDGCEKVHRGSDDTRAAKSRIHYIESDILEQFRWRFEAACNGGDEYFRCKPEEVPDAIRIIVDYAAKLNAKSMKHPLRTFGSFPYHQITTADFAEL